MGLGKTVIILTAINYLLNAGKIRGALIVAPLRVAYNVWPEEIKKWDHLSHLTSTILHGPHKNKLLKDKKDIYVLNYEGISWLESTLSRYKRDKYPFDMIVFDESTAIKNHQTVRFRRLKKIIKAFNRRIILTGTPSPNTLEDLWSQYYMLDDGDRLGQSFTGFRTRYFYKADFNGFSYRPLPRTPLEISDKVKDITVRLTAEEYLDMPELINNDVKWSMSEKVRKEYVKFEQTYLAEIGKETVVAVNAAALSIKLRQFLSGFIYSEDKTHEVHLEKIDILKEVVEQNRSEQVIIAIQFRYEYEMIQRVYPNVPVIYGGLSPSTVRKRIQNWNGNNSPILIVHPASIAHGVNLQQGGRTIIWYSLPWSYEHYTQLRARLYRQGQKKPVVMHHLIANGTVETNVIKALSDKKTSESSFTKRLISSIRSEKWNT